MQPALEVPTLREMCCRCLGKAHLDLDNVIGLLRFSAMHDVPVLRKRALKFVNFWRNFDALEKRHTEAELRAQLGPEISTCTACPLFAETADIRACKWCKRGKDGCSICSACCCMLCGEQVSSSCIEPHKRKGVDCRCTYCPNDPYNVMCDPCIDGGGLFCRVCGEMGAWCPDCISRHGDSLRTCQDEWGSPALHDFRCN